MTGHGSLSSANTGLTRPPKPKLYHAPTTYLIVLLAIAVANVGAAKESLLASGHNGKDAIPILGTLVEAIDKSSSVVMHVASKRLAGTHKRVVRAAMYQCARNIRSEQGGLSRVWPVRTNAVMMETKATTFTYSTSK